MIKRIGFTAIAALTLSVAAQAADSSVGKWEWNKAKSKGSSPEQVAATVVFKARPDGGRTLNLIQRFKDGTTVTWDYSCSYDGKECPAKVSDGAFDTVSVKRVDAQKVIVVMTQKGGKHNVTNTSITSKDGKSTSGTAEGTDANGKPVSRTFFFDRK
jgi:Neuraminidase (sialidase)